MTAYATLADLYAYGFPSATFGSLSSTVQQQAIDEACTMVDGYLRGRYQLPLLAWDTDLKRVVAVIAAKNLLDIRGHNPNTGSDQVISERYGWAIDWLKGVQRGSVHPNVTPYAAEPGTKYAQPQAISARLPRGW